jgi:hypothetical protein
VPLALPRQPHSGIGREPRAPPAWGSPLSSPHLAQPISRPIFPANGMIAGGFYRALQSDRLEEGSERAAVDSRNQARWLACRIISKSAGTLLARSCNRADIWTSSSRRRRWEFLSWSGSRSPGKQEAQPNRAEKLTTPVHVSFLPIPMNSCRRPPNWRNPAYSAYWPPKKRAVANRAASAGSPCAARAPSTTVLMASRC